MLKFRNGLPTKKSIINGLANYGIVNFSFAGYKEKDYLSIFWQSNNTQEKIKMFTEFLENSNINFTYRAYETPCTGCIKILKSNMG